MNANLTLLVVGGALVATALIWNEASAARAAFLAQDALAAVMPR